MIKKIGSRILVSIGSTLPLKSLLFLSGLSAGMVNAGSLEQAKRIHDRLTGVPPSEAVLVEMANMIDTDGDGVRAALYAIDNDENHDFYNVTLKNWISPWTNEEFSVFVDLNDYSATLIGAIRDDLDFRTAFYDDIIYVADPELGLTSYAANNNAHYEALQGIIERNDSNGQATLKSSLERRAQSEVTELPANAVAGVTTSRAASRAFFSAGTNRAQFRFTLLNQLCMDLEQVHDVSLPPDRIRQDVSRSPGGDARVFLNTCVGCHSGMDPLAQAFAYYEYVYDAENDESGANGHVEYIGNAADDPETGFAPVQAKYLINSATFRDGYVTPNEKWENYWRKGQNARLGWDESLDGKGTGASSMVQELVHSQAFASCQVEKVFKAVCLRDPHSQGDLDVIGQLTQSFQNSQTNPLNPEQANSAFSIKRLFANTADYCKGE